MIIGVSVLPGVVRTLLVLYKKKENVKYKIGEFVTKVIEFHLWNDKMCEMTVRLVEMFKILQTFPKRMEVNQGCTSK